MTRLLCVEFWPFCVQWGFNIFVKLFCDIFPFPVAAYDFKLCSGLKMSFKKLKLVHVVNTLHALIGHSPTCRVDVLSF